MFTTVDWRRGYVETPMNNVSHVYKLQIERRSVNKERIWVSI